MILALIASTGAPGCGHEQHIHDAGADGGILVVGGESVSDAVPEGAAHEAGSDGLGETVTSPLSSDSATEVEGTEVAAADNAPGLPDTAVDAVMATSDASADGSAAGGSFSFVPSNIAIEQLRLHDVANLAPAVLDSPNCEIEMNGDSREIRCYTTPHFIETVAGQRYLKVRLANGQRLDVFLARSWTITERASLSAPGLVVLAALEDILIDGSIDLTGRAPGIEPGVGSMGSYRVGAGGGGHCGRGGAGAYSDQGGGMEYGGADLIPPHAGASGGPDALQSGVGGGFLHLLAGRRVRIGATGKVSAGGTRGYGGGGGGSGGAILIEAPRLTMAGVVAANGGGGGATSAGEDGAASAIPAAGGKGPLGESVAGRGSAGTAIEGEDALSISVTAGGGGAAGRIRLNTNTDEAQLTGIFSPSLGTRCTTQGTLQSL